MNLGIDSFSFSAKSEEEWLRGRQIDFNSD